MKSRSAQVPTDPGCRSIRSGRSTMSTHQEALVSTQGTLQTMYQSPRIRRLRNDLAALERLRSESSVFRFSTAGDPPHQYHILFQGKGLWRDRGKVKILDHHRVEIKLGASYPRTMPEIRWVTPIYHPNISEIGMVCLGGYGTHWVPSVQLDELCIMLWDMVALPQLRHSKPLQPRCRALGRESDDVSVSDRCPAAPRPASLTRAGGSRRG